MRRWGARSSAVFWRVLSRRCSSCRRCIRSSYPTARPFSEKLCSMPNDATDSSLPRCRIAACSKLINGVGVLSMLALLAGDNSAAAGRADKYPPGPQTKMDAVEEVIHGVKIADPYRWLEDQRSPATRDWI